MKRQENVDLIEMCEHSDKPQCPHWQSNRAELLRVWNLAFLRTVRPFAKSIFNVTKLRQKATNPHYTLKTSGRGRRHGKSERQELHHKAQYALRCTRKHGHNSILHRYLTDVEYREYQISAHEWTKQSWKQLGKNTVTDVSCNASSEERQRHSKHWIF